MSHHHISHRFHGMGHPMMGLMGMMGASIMFSGPKEWEIEFDTLPSKKNHGPFAAEEITFFYNDRKYHHIFGQGLAECNGKIKIKRRSDTEWSNLDEVGLLLLMVNMPQSDDLKHNGLTDYIKQLYEKNYGLWIYRYGTCGSRVYGAKTVIEMKQVEWKKTYDKGIFVKRIGELGWYESDDIDLHILFHHLNIHKHYVPQMGIKHIEETVRRAHTTKLRPHVVYDEWEIIRLLMKAMRVDQYFEELQNYCQEQEVYHIVATAAI